MPIAKAVLGYAVLGSSALLLVATQLSASVPNLPGGGYIYTVAESQWNWRAEEYT